MASRLKAMKAKRATLTACRRGRWAAERVVLLLREERRGVVEELGGGGVGLSFRRRRALEDYADVLGRALVALGGVPGAMAAAERELGGEGVDGDGIAAGGGDLGVVPGRAAGGGGRRSGT